VAEAVAEAEAEAESFRHSSFDGSKNLGKKNFRT